MLERRRSFFPRGFSLPLDIRGTGPTAFWPAEAQNCSYGKLNAISAFPQGITSGGDEETYFESCERRRRTVNASLAI
jgi:hypothetical protein